MCVRDPLGNRTIILHIGPERKKMELNLPVSPDIIDQLIAKKTGGKNKECHHLGETVLIHYQNL